MSVALHTSAPGPHRGQPIRTAGVLLEQARVAVVLTHGRGANADSILSLAAEQPREGVAFVAPQAARNTWYPYAFLEPMERNEPWLSSALAVLADVVGLIEQAGVPAARILLLGFSQGACLTTEFVARNARRYGGVAGLSGGLIGPPGTPRDYPGSLAGTPVFLGCSDIDPHIPLERVAETSAVFERMGAVVDTRIYPGMGHTINADELEQVRAMVTALIQAAAGG